MNVNFDNILEHVISINDFGLKWRFTNEKYERLPDQHLEQLKSLDNEASKFLSNYISKVDLHNEQPFKKDFFRTIDQINILDGNEKEIKKWLYHRGLPFDKQVFLTWDSNNAIIVPWKLLIKYFDSFYYSGSDDITIIDESLNWAILFSHCDTIYFGSNLKYTANDNFEDL